MELVIAQAKSELLSISVLVGHSVGDQVPSARVTPSISSGFDFAPPSTPYPSPYYHRSFYPGYNSPLVSDFPFQYLYSYQPASTYQTPSNPFKCASSREIFLLAYVVTIGTQNCRSHQTIFALNVRNGGNLHLKGLELLNQTF